MHPDPRHAFGQNPQLAAGRVRRRTLLAAGVAGLGGLSPLAVLAQVPPSARPVVLSPTLPDAPVAEIGFEVAGDAVSAADDRLVFATLRCTVPLQAISLLDPAGRTVWRRSAAELGFRARATLPQPELGDGYVLPPVREAASGRWRLRVERGPPAGGGGRLQLAYGVFPRFELDIVPQRLRGSAGQTLLLSVRPREHGLPMAGLQPIEVDVLDAQGRRVARVAASEDAMSREGIALAREPGVYRARLSLPAPGPYRLQATRRLGASAASTKTAVAELTVDGQAGTLALLAVRLDAGTGGCARGLLLDFAVHVPTAGTYACNLTLRGGDPLWPRAGATAALAGGPGRITVAVSAAKLAAIGLPWQRLDRAVLLQVREPAFRVVAELADVELSGYAIDHAALCR